jgi:PIN domain nuclease of toxin-antitoxin system
MKLLLDTAAALFLWAGDERLSTDARHAIADPANELVFHQVSYLEITLKFSLGKLPLTEPPSLLVPKALEAYRIRFARLANDDIRALEALPFHHRDPFDRLLIAHSQRRGLVFVTPDSQVRRYQIPLLW